MKIGGIKSRLPLILAIGVPVVFIIIVALVAWVPRLLAHPKYDFVYYTTSGYVDFSEYYRVTNGTLTRACKWASSAPRINNTQPGVSLNNATSVYSQEYSNCENVYASTVFYRYSMATKQSTRISEQAVAALKLSSEEISPDGYSLEQGSYNTTGLWYGGTSDDPSQYYLVTDSGVRIKLGRLQTGTGNRDNTFLGWIQ